jgi:hypothetical protein
LEGRGCGLFLPFSIYMEERFFYEVLPTASIVWKDNVSENIGRKQI